MTKAIFRLLWDVILIDLAKFLGFNSPKAQASFMSATGKHKIVLFYKNEYLKNFVPTFII